MIKIYEQSAKEYKDGYIDTIYEVTVINPVSGYYDYVPFPSKKEALDYAKRNSGLEIWEHKYLYDTPEMREFIDMVDDEFDNLWHWENLNVGR